MSWATTCHGHLVKMLDADKWHAPSEGEIVFGTVSLGNQRGNCSGDPWLHILQFLIEINKEIAPEASKNRVWTEPALMGKITFTEDCGELCTDEAAASDVAAAFHAIPKLLDDWATRRGHGIKRKYGHDCDAREAWVSARCDKCSKCSKRFKAVLAPGTTGHVFCHGKCDPDRPAIVKKAKHPVTKRLFADLKAKATGIGKFKRPRNIQNDFAGPEFEGMPGRCVQNVCARAKQTPTSELDMSGLDAWVAARRTALNTEGDYQPIPTDLQETSVFHYSSEDGLRLCRAGWAQSGFATQMKTV